MNSIVKEIALTDNSSMTRHKVLFIDSTAVLGGAELSLLDLATAYRQSSDVLLFEDGPFRERLKAAGVNVEVIPAPQAARAVRTSGGLSSLKAVPALWEMAHQVAQAGKGFDLVHANTQKAFIVAALARLRGGAPVVWHLRDILTAGHFSKLNRQVAVTLANLCAKKVFVNSQATGQAFVAAGGRKDLVKVIYNGFAINSFGQQASQIRTELGLKNAPLVGVFSRISYWKGQHILLEAMRELPDVHALIVGEALFGEYEYNAKLRKLANSPALKGRVHWLGFRDDIPALMAACNIVVHTSTEPEPFGRVIVEGQLARRPVIATAAGGAVELIQNGKTGRLVPPGDVLALAKAIGELFADSTTAETLAQQGYRYARSNFSLAAMLVNFETALEDVMQKR